MFITNEFARRDPACIAAMEGIMKQEMMEAKRRQDIRLGRIPAPQGQWTNWHISDRH